MIFGIGVDIIDINTFTESFNSSKRFKQRAFIESEIQYCESQPNSYQHFAGKFAAKEGLMKALGIGWNKGVQWKHVEILNSEDGKPLLKFYGKIKKLLNENAVKDYHVSISHSEAYAIAFVILEL
jgi:holo-[acyl-carrier protein] synthase